MQDETEALSDQPVQQLDVMSGDALQSLERASIDIQISTARKYPRVLKVVVHKMEQSACLDRETAEACFYSLPRGGKNIEGPSIRLAEIALASYGNLRFASRNIAVVASGDQPHVICQAVVHDLENNVLGAVEKRRRITAKKKNNGRVDEDDINLAVNACSSIALRDAAFKVIPLALIKPVFRKARQVAIGDAASLNDRRNKMLDTFGKMGVSKERVCAAVEKGMVEEIGLDELATLIGTYNAIRDGQSTVDEAFPVEKPTTATAPKIVPRDEGDGLPPAPGPATAPAKPRTAKAKTVTQPATAPATSDPVRQADNTKRGGGATMVEAPLDDPLPAPSAQQQGEPVGEDVL